MAVAQLNLSRRALLGAAFAAPVLGAAAHAVPGGGGQGHVLSRHPGLDSHQSSTLMGSLDPGPRNTAATPADADVFLGSGFRRNDEEVWCRALARFQKAKAALAALAHTSDEARYDRAGARHDLALQRLLRTPSPHAAALADKLDLLIAHQAWELTAGDLCLAAIRTDARRFAGASA
jgi:hypothetical protein